MCGIIGILSQNEAAPLVLEGLKKLEYRGYDSAGIATVQNGVVSRRRATGKLVNLSDVLVHEPLAGKVGIGHTRWATHGAPNVINAHPHMTPKVAVVHNGIIENFKELRGWLLEQGIQHQTDTDTETISLVADVYLRQGHTPQQAAAQTIARLQGAYALCFVFEGDDDLMIAARQGSPLAIGYGDCENYVGSDAIALAHLTQDISYLDEGDWAVIRRESMQVYDQSGVAVSREVQKIEAEAFSAEKGAYKHFMAKEIAEQPTVLSDTLQRYITQEGDAYQLQCGFDFTSVDRIVMVACGTAFYACMVAKYWFEQVAKLPVEIDIASEFRYREPVVGPKTAAIFVSQSGETADTMAALTYMKGKAEAILGVVNVETSSIARVSDVVLPISAGPEIGVASTKAFTCQLMTLAILALSAAKQREVIGSADLQDMLKNLHGLPSLMNAALAIEAQCESLSMELAEARDILFLGRGVMYPLAHEGALKLKEISYIHAEAYAAGELKHGPIALIDKHVPVIVMAPKDRLFEKTVSNMQEVIARGGRVLLITDRAGAMDVDAMSGELWKTLILPEVDPFLAPILYALPAQLLAYYTAISKGTDVDQPRNLAKSVTVE